MEAGVAELQIVGADRPCRCDVTLRESLRHQRIEILVGLCERQLLENVPKVSECLYTPDFDGRSARR